MNESLENKNLNSPTLMDGFFMFFGFGNNPAEIEVNEIMKHSPGEKLRSDVKKINSDLKDAFNEIKSGALISNE